LPVSRVIRVLRVADASTPRLGTSHCAEHRIAFPRQTGDPERGGLDRGSGETQGRLTQIAADAPLSFDPPVDVVDRGRSQQRRAQETLSR
jgi:hypothetical protein